MRRRRYQKRGRRKGNLALTAVLMVALLSGAGLSVMENIVCFGKELSVKADSKSFTEEIISLTFPVVGAKDSGRTEKTPSSAAGKQTKVVAQGLPTAAAVKSDEEVEPIKILDTAQSKQPVVLIHHTHATESYQPVSVGNFHSIDESGTVREVGTELKKALEAKGIAVVQDKTIHDSPSYNQSYGRSLVTVKNYLKKNPSIKIVIDLHRDAASYSGNTGKTVTIKGNTVAKYNFVVGKGNANYSQLMAFAKEINQKAEMLYPGFSGRIIEKEYRFNEYLHDRYLLLEVGNNENTIDQAKLCTRYFAEALAQYIKEMP